jgi:hypothetical protein
MKIKLKHSSAILRDAMRYRFLRSLQSRDHNGRTTRALEVEIQDWGKRLGDKNSPFWASMPVTEKAMDRAVDAAMRKSLNAESSNAREGGK